MYYEEKLIDGVMCWRNDPEGEWTAYTLEELSQMYQGAKLAIARWQENYKTTCGDCGHPLQEVRPGGHQCDYCELEWEVQNLRSDVQRNAEYREEAVSHLVRAEKAEAELKELLTDMLHETGHAKQDAEMERDQLREEWESRLRGYDI